MFTDFIKRSHKIIRYAIHVFMVIALLALFTFSMMLLTGYTKLGDEPISNLKLYAFLIGFMLFVLVQWKIMLAVFTWVSKRQFDRFDIKQDRK